MATKVRLHRSDAVPGSVDDADAGLVNADLVPTPLAQRTWTSWSYAALWMGMVHSAFGFAVLGGMIAGGLSAVQALVVVFIANMVQLALMILTGRVGARFGILSRSGRGRRSAFAARMCPPSFGGLWRSVGSACRATLVRRRLTRCSGRCSAGGGRWITRSPESRRTCGSR